MDYPFLVRTDETGNGLGPVDFYTAHAKTEQEKGVRHLSSNVIILGKSKEEILITRRSKKIESGGLLSSVIGGHIDWLEDRCCAEDPEITAYRELQEEIFYRCNLPSEIVLEKVGSFNKDIRISDPEYTHIYKTFYDGPFFPNPEEVIEFYFQDFHQVFNEIQRHPEDYTRSSLFFLQKLGFK